MAQRVAKALALTLLPAEQARLAGAKTVDPEAYDLILKGKHASKGTRAGFDLAEQYYLRALAKDPAAAEAYAGLANNWLTRQQFGLAPVREAGPKAKAAALKAIELDDTLAKAHMALGNVHWLVEFDLPGAEREFRRALELNPSDVGANSARLLTILRRPDEAMREIERVMAIDPLVPGPRGFYANLLAFGRTLRRGARPGQPGPPREPGPSHGLERSHHCPAHEAAVRRGHCRAGDLL